MALLCTVVQKVQGELKDFRAMQFIGAMVVVTVPGLKSLHMCTSKRPFLKLQELHSRGTMVTIYIKL
jgi:hypothetical protein